MKYLFILFIGFMMFPFEGIGQSLVYGKITDQETGEELIYANIVLETQNGTFVTGTSTDFEGNYTLSVADGIYTLKISYTGYPDREITDILIKDLESFQLDVEMETGIAIDVCIFLPYYPIPLIEHDNTSSIYTQRSPQIQKAPVKNINKLIINSPGVSFNW